MNNKSRISESIRFAAIGWLAGMVSTVVLGLLWPIFLPAIVNVEHYYESGPSLIAIIGLMLAWATPAALFGGLIGGRLTLEGGSRSQKLFAILFGIILALPCAGFGYWSFTGE